MDTPTEEEGEEEDVLVEEIMEEAVEKVVGEVVEEVVGEEVEVIDVNVQDEEGVVIDVEDSVRHFPVGLECPQRPGWHIVHPEGPGSGKERSRFGSHLAGGLASR